MKPLILSILVTFCTLFSFGQSQSLLGTQEKAAPISQVFFNSEFATVDKTSNNSSFYNIEKELDQCRNARTLRSVGVLFSCLGTGVFVGGIVMAVSGRNENAAYNNYYNSGGGGFYAGSDGLALERAGYICMGVGGATMVGGITMAVIGTSRAHRFCGASIRYRYRSNMELHTNGNNLALNF